jgi:hypothetical protein
LESLITCWQDKDLLALADRTGAKQAYRSALSAHLFEPVRSEVMEILKRL